jgi:predicted RNase H-like nuclease
LNKCDPPLNLQSHAATIALLNQPSPTDDRFYKHREDLIDALICAWTAALWCRFGLSRCQVLGSLGTLGSQPNATIIAPYRDSQRGAVSAL